MTQFNKYKIQQYKSFQLNYKSPLSYYQRLQNKYAYYKRRLIRLTKRAGWLKRKNNKFLKRIRKQRRYFISFNKNQQRILVRSKRIYTVLSKPARHNFVNVVFKTNKYYNPILTKYKIQKYKSLFALKLDQYQYFN